MAKYVLGLDFGTLSGRAVLADIATGEIISEKAENYPLGVIEGVLPNGEKMPEQFSVASPENYRDVMDHVIIDVVKNSGVSKEDIIGIGLDVTSSTFVPVDREGTPLCEKEAFAGNPHAWMKMWKHHHAQPQADRLTALMNEREEPFRDRCGRKMNAEWMMPKLLETFEEAPEIFRETYNFMEAGDYLVYLLTGEMTKSEGMLGYKMLGGTDSLPISPEFLDAAAPGFSEVMDKLAGTRVKLGACAGRLTEAKAALYGLCPGISVAAANIDAHVAFPALGITEPGSMLLILGTSCCSIMMSEKETFVPGIFGAVRDGVMPGYIGYEAGQSAVGDAFSWFTENLVPGDCYEKAEEKGMSIQQYLTSLAEKLKPGESGLLALDWWNGNRSVLSDADLTGMILGLTLKTKPEEVYRALIEGVAFGLREIVENYAVRGIETEKLYACGGISKKNPMLLQIYADILDKEIYIGKSLQSPALGSAIHAAVAAGKACGGYDDIYEAAKMMGHTEENTVKPIHENHAVYERLYREYHRLHDYFGRGENDVMKNLLKIRLDQSRN